MIASIDRADAAIQAAAAPLTGDATIEQANAALNIQITSLTLQIQQLDNEIANGINSGATDEELRAKRDQQTALQAQLTTATANRMLCPMINEAVFVLGEGLATAAEIDEAMKLGCNHPIGPLALADLIGLDVELAVMQVLYEGFKDPKFRPAPLLVEMVEAGRLGRKTGEGFYRYDR